jgi:glycosyltransferase involved in cell wall biosynthesis
MKLMVCNGARGGMSSVVAAYVRDGFVSSENVRLIYSYNNGSFLYRQLILLNALVQFVWCLATKRVELVHCHVSMWGSFWRKGLFAQIAGRCGIPVVLHLHGSEMKKFYHAQGRLGRALIRRRLENAARVIVLSEGWREFIESISPKARITIVPNYVKVPKSLDETRRSRQGILFLGLVGPRKGTLDLIHAFKVVHDIFPGARLTIGGDGNLAEARAQIAELRLEGPVDLAGWVDGEAKAELIERSAIYALPSYNEGLPVSLLEAMAAGLAVVTTRVGGIPELVTDEIDGLLIEPGDRTKLASSLVSLLRDTALRDRLAAAGRNKVEKKYSDKTVFPLLHDIYRECSRRI